MMALPLITAFTIAAAYGLLLLIFFATRKLLHRPCPPPLKTNSKKVFLIAASIVAGLFLSEFLLANPVFNFFEKQSTQQGQHVQADQVKFIGPISGFPADARDFNFQTSPQGSAADFHVSEQRFTQWCQKEDLPITPIKEVKAIHTYDWKLVSVNSGWYGERSLGDNGASVAVAYDKKTERAYYHYVAW